MWGVRYWGVFTYLVLALRHSVPGEARQVWGPAAHSHHRRPAGAGGDGGEAEASLCLRVTPGLRPVSGQVWAGSERQAARETLHVTLSIQIGSENEGRWSLLHYRRFSPSSPSEGKEIFVQRSTYDRLDSTLRFHLHVQNQNQTDTFLLVLISLKLRWCNADQLRLTFWSRQEYSCSVAA